MTNPGGLPFCTTLRHLPIWTVAGAVDWWCHRSTKIEENSGHARAHPQHHGVQVGLPIPAV